VFPYTKALTSGALILAMSFGRACIAPRMGAIADTLNAEGGFLYEPAEPAALRNALVAADAAAPRLTEMGAHNFERARQWGWDEAARATAAAYRGCFVARR
jgi:glycosyltransferase involved in cell wall biosynthesis